MRVKRINLIINNDLIIIKNIWGIFSRKIGWSLWNGNLFFETNKNYKKFLNKISYIINFYNFGWYIRLKFHGFGYKYKIFKQKLRIYVGYCHNIDFWFPISLYCLKEKRFKNQILLFSCNNLLLKKTIKILKNIRPLNPYKFLGILYTIKEEHIKKKQGKQQFK